MALYFLHLSDGHDALIDPEGRDVANASEIGDVTLREARAMISQDALAGSVDLNQFIEVRNESGKLIYQLAFRDAVTIVNRA